MTAAVLAATTADDPAGLPPSRLMTPYWRSKPVVIASETNAAAITARAIDPGSSAVDRPPPDPVPAVSNALNTSRTPTGITNVIRRPSPRRRASRSSLAARAAAISGHGAGRAGAPVPITSRRRRRRVVEAPGSGVVVAGVVRPAAAPTSSR